MNNDLNNDEFYNYLKNLGIVDDNSILKIKNIYNEIINSNKNLALNKVMCAALIYYLSNLDSTQRNKISLNLILNYYNLGNKNKKEKLLNLIKNKNNINIKLLLLKKFIQWKNIINTIKTKEKNKTKPKNKNRINNNNNLNKNDYYNSITYSTYSNNGKNSILSTNKN